MTADKGGVTGGQNCRASIAAFFSELRAFEASLGAGHPPGSSSGQSWLHARCFWYFCCSLSRSCFSSVAAAAGQDGWYGIGSWSARAYSGSIAQHQSSPGALHSHGGGAAAATNARHGPTELRQPPGSTTAGQCEGHSPEAYFWSMMVELSFSGRAGPEVMPAWQRAGEQGSRR